MGPHTIALFGEAEKGEYRIPYICHSVPQLHDRVGAPPEDSMGIYYAIQALLHQYELVFFRVREEGFSYTDYSQGVKILRDQLRELSAICLPGVGDGEILETVVPICAYYHSVLIISEADLYDYLTDSSLE
jgi:hypothetical protein